MIKGIVPSLVGPTSTKRFPPLDTVSASCLRRACKFVKAKSNYKFISLVTDLLKVRTYSLRPKLSTKSCFMKQKCQLQMGIVKYKNAATPLSTSGINTTRQHFQMRYITLFQLKGLKSYQLSKFECVDFNSKIDFTFLLWLITFELLELKQSYILHLKVLTCGIDA